MKLYKTIAIFSFFLFFSFAAAQSVSELKVKIDERNNNIKLLEEEIKKYQAEIEGLGKQASSLKNTISSLDLSRKKLEADLSVTQNKIQATNLEITELSLQIGDKNQRIVDGKRVISQALYAISQISSDSLVTTLLSSKTLAEAWNNADELNTLQSGVRDRIHDLKSVKLSLEDNKKKTEAKKSQLVSLQKDLSNQKKILAETVKEKNSLLSQTKNTEANYKKVLASRQAQKEAFERELLEYESALRIAIDPSKIPSTGSGVLSWPLSKIRITQHFGNTSFATANPQIYNGKGHTGIDFAASIGTPVKASLGGIVAGVANTDLYSGCLSYGKWIMIRHANGLSTLYAHLSLQTVSVGDAVSSGQVIGYSGNTGYSTGPHLHFGVYATQGVQIRKFDTSINCKGATIPLADLKAYLNPLSYL
ncbi:MAG: peptidoglycan DD-metalloendopeptidase family protein [bacterium]|nr:peptidoglycan DD-metalloendopeptidase family protein [bacterium]